MNRKQLIFLKIVFFILIFTYIIFSYGNFVFYEYDIGTQGGSGYISGYNLLFLYGVFEVIIILISLMLLYSLKIKLSILFGIFGCFLIGLELFSLLNKTLFNPPLGYQYQILPWFYICIICWCTICLILLLLTIIKLTENRKHEKLIKEKVLELGTQFTRLQIREIAEKCGFDSEFIIRIIKTMVNMQEIYAEYFSSTRTVAFNQQANIEEIDNLMAKFRDWEGDKK